MVGYFIYKTDLKDVAAIRVGFGSGLLGNTKILAWTLGEQLGKGPLAWETYADVPSRGDRDVAFVRDLVLATREAGAILTVVEIGGEVGGAEIARVPGATRGVIDDISDPPALAQK